MVQQIQGEAGGEVLELWKVDDHPAQAATDCVKIYVLDNAIFTKDDQGNVRPGAVVRGHVHNANIFYVDATHVRIGASGVTSEVVDGSATSVVELTSGVTIDTQASGAGGLDTGSITGTTIYAVHLIWDSSGTNPAAGLLSLSADAPTLPSGYDKFRRVGWVSNTQYDELAPFIQDGTGRDRWVYYTADRDDLQALNAGGATVYTDVDLSQWVPPTTRTFALEAVYIPDSGGNLFYLRTNGVTLAGAEHRYNGPSVADWYYNLGHGLACDENGKIEYKVDNASDTLDLWVQGFQDHL